MPRMQGTTGHYETISLKRRKFLVYEVLQGNTGNLFYSEAIGANILTRSRQYKETIWVQAVIKCIFSTEPENNNKITLVCFYYAPVFLNFARDKVLLPEKNFCWSNSKQFQQLLLNYNHTCATMADCIFKKSCKDISSLICSSQFGHSLREGNFLPLLALVWTLVAASLKTMRYV